MKAFLREQIIRVFILMMKTWFGDFDWDIGFMLFFFQRKEEKALRRELELSGPVRSAM